MEPTVVFVSYAHEDTDVRIRLNTVLKPLVRKGHLEVWADDRIAAGRLWRDEIETSLRRASVAVLLVSADFLASDYIMDVELPRIIERHLPLLCIPVGACRWGDIDAIASVQWPLSPARPINAMTRDERDTALVAASDAVAALVAARGEGADELEQVGGPPPHASLGGWAAELSPAAEPGPLAGVPPLPAYFLARPRDLDGLKELLLGTDGGQPVGLLGVGGIGKSVLAAAACHDPDVRRMFADGVYWVSLGESPDPVAEQRMLAHWVGAEATFSTTAEGVARLRDLFAQRRCLIVVDDVWDADAAKAFAVAGAPGRVLYTTRDRTLLAGLGAVVQLVNTLDLRHSVALLEQVAGVVDIADRPTVERIAGQTRGVPLALTLVAGVRRSGRSWPEAALLLDGLDAIFGNHAYADVFKAMRLAIDTLSPGDAHQYRALAVFPEDVAVPAATVARFWQVPDATEMLRRLADRGLLAFDGDHLRFHDLQRTFLQFDADRSQADLHRQLLERHRPPGGWPYLGDDPYLRDYLMYHLEQSGEYAELVSVATSGRWLAHRLHRDGAYPALADLDRALAVEPDSGTAADARDVLHHWGALFRGDLSIAATAATLISRWPPAAADASDLRDAVWLEPAGPLPRFSPALQRTLTTDFRSVRSVAFDPDGMHLFCSGSGGSSIRSWDVVTGLEGDTATCGDDRIDVVALDAARGLAAIVPFTDSSAVRLWDARTGMPLDHLRGQTTRVNALAFSPDGRLLAGAGWDEFLTVWEIDGTRKRKIPCSFLGRVWALAFASDGSALVGVGDRGAAVWEVPSGRVRAQYRGHTEMVEQVAFGPGGDLVASAGRDTSIALWDARDGSERVVLRGHTSTVTALAFAPDGGCLASAAHDGTVRIWDLATSAERAVLIGHAGGIYALAFSPDARTLATADLGGNVRLWDPTAAVGTADAMSAAAVRKVAFSPDGTTVAVGRSQGYVHCWDRQARVVVTDFASMPGAVSGLGFVRGGSAVAVADLSGRLSIRDATSAETAVLLEGYPTAIGNRTIWDLAVMSDGLSFVTGDGIAVRVWDAASGEQIAANKIDPASVTAVAVNPGGDRIAFGLGWYSGKEIAPGDRLHFWDWATGRTERATWADRSIKAMAWSPDGDLLALAVSGGEVQLYDLRRGMEQASMTAAAAELAFSPDGTILAGACDDGTVRLWRVADGHEAALRLGTIVSCLDWAPDGAFLAVGFESYWTELRVGIR